MKRLRTIVTVLAGLALGACCKDGACIKEPPCRVCENPCCLTPVQKKALAGGNHALVAGPVVYTYDEKSYYLFTETGLKDFEKDPTGFDEKGAIRVIRGGKTRRVDMSPGDDFNWVAADARARPYTKPK